MKINGELGKVLSTSPEHKQWNCGMGIFKPGVVYWEENPEGRVIIDGKRCKILSKTEYDKNYVLIGGKNYKTAKIGNQTWLAEDLNCTFEGINIKQGDQLSANPAMYYWNNTCFYNGNAISKIIVPGWRIPTIDDFDILVEAVGGISVAGQKLKLSKWSGTNEFGFNGDCVGSMYASGYFGGDGQFVRYWSSTTTTGTTYMYYMQLRTADNAATAGKGSNYSSKNIAYSVRLVKDA